MARSRFAFLASNPRDRHTPLRQLEEVTRLRQALDASLLKRRVDVDQYLTARYDDLIRILRDRPEVLYFTGFHASEQGGIVLEDARGNSTPIMNKELVQLFGEFKPQIRLVYLTACYTDQTAQALARLADCTVGFNGLLADDFANRFSELFFASLFACQPISVAFASAMEEAANDPSVAEAQKFAGTLDCPRIFYRHGVPQDELKAFSARPLTIFISYGGPDNAVAERLNNALEARGIETFLFVHDAKAGRPLHRVMHRGVNEHDFVVLICSKDSLVRPGVLNEIEESLKKSSRQGGRNILVPLAIDDFVYASWKPDRDDLAVYVRDLVIADFRQAIRGKMAFGKAVDKLVEDLAGPD